MPEDMAFTPAEAVRLAQRLIDDGRPFHAHEVLEAAWKAADAGERELWRGLAQVAVGLTHLQRGNARGAVALLQRGAGNVTRWRVGWLGPVPAGLDVDDVVRRAEELASRIEREGPDAATPDDLRPRLR